MNHIAILAALVAVLVMATRGQSRDHVQSIPDAIGNGQPARNLPNIRQERDEIRTQLSLHEDHRQPEGDDYAHVAGRSGGVEQVLGSDLGTPYPTTCGELRRVVAGGGAPLPSGFYKVYIPGTEQHEAHGFRPKERHVFCEMDGENVDHTGVEDISLSVYEITPLRRDCADFKLANQSAASGTYTIRHSAWWITGEMGVYYLPIFVYCDMETDGGGWTVFQRRLDGAVDFHRPLQDYRQGFGAIGGSHWLGLRFSHLIIAHTLQSLRVDMVSRVTGEHTFASYAVFDVDDEASGYRLTVEHFINGTHGQGDQMQGNHGMRFSTVDNDQDQSPRHCAQVHRGGYWYNNCGTNNLNGVHSEHEGDMAMFWGSEDATDVQVSTQMAFRQACFL